MNPDPAEQLERAIREDARYPLEAFDFLRQALAWATREVHGEAAVEAPHHVSGQQLCEGLRDLARHRWGALAGEVLHRWNIRSTRDFGEMVFLLVSLGALGKQDSDDIDDFDNVYDFDEAFNSYVIPLEDDE
jgi:uncharacterized repeat protein (TIGR04138 family)